MKPNYCSLPVPTCIIWDLSQEPVDMNESDSSRSQMAVINEKSSLIKYLEGINA